VKTFEELAARQFEVPGILAISLAISAQPMTQQAMKLNGQTFFFQYEYIYI
jgi:hypothetical protein